MILVCIIIVSIFEICGCSNVVLSSSENDVRERARNVRMMLRHGVTVNVEDFFDGTTAHACDDCLRAALEKTLDRCEVALPFFERCDAESCYDLIELNPEKIRVHQAHCYEQIGRHLTALHILSNVLIGLVEKKEKVNDMMVRLILQRIILVRRALDKPSSTTEAFFRSAVRTFRLPYETSLQIPLEYDITFQNAIPWHDVRSNRIALMLEEHAEEIRNEFETALCEIVFDVQFDRDLVKGKRRDGWGKYNLMRNGIWNSERCATRFPFVCSLLREAPEISHLFEGEVAFLELKKGVNLLPHFGPTNTRLTIHLGLMTPPNVVKLRVGNETRRQVASKSLVFDDSFEHEVTWDEEKIDTDDRVCHECNSDGSRYILSVHTHNRNRNLFS